MLINGSVVNGAAINGSYGGERDFYDIKANSIRTTYKVLVTGALDNLSDLELPASTIQVRMGVDPDRIYLSAVINGIDAYIDAINLRPNGSLSIARIYHYIDGTQDSFNMGVVPFDSFETYEGGRAGLTGVLSGNASLTLGTPKPVTLTDLTTKSNISGGGVRYTVKLDPRLRPKDNATINGTTFTVQSIILYVATNIAYMQVSG
jgi:hypothetical protein